jgi:hypothetical protein
MELPFDPTIPLLSIQPRDMKPMPRRDICTSMFVTALFPITKVQKLPKCPSIDEWINKL